MMFKTYSSAAVFNPFANKDEKYWSYAELTVNHPWILAMVISQDEEYPCYSTLFLSSAAQLKDLDERDNLKIKEVHVVTPSYMNTDKTWQMNEVSRISKGVQKYKSFESTVIKYELVNGNEIYDSNIGRKVSKNTKFEVIFSSINIGN